MILYPAWSRRLKVLRVKPFVLIRSKLRAFISQPEQIISAIGQRCSSASARIASRNHLHPGAIIVMVLAGNKTVAI